MGRPTSYREEFCEQAVKLCKLGATDRDLSDFFEVSESTLNLWKLQHVKFSESLKLAKEEADNRVEQSLYRRALGYSHDAVKIVGSPKDGIEKVPYVEHYPPETVACIFWLKNRRSDAWRDKTEAHVTGTLSLSKLIEQAVPGG